MDLVLIRGRERVKTENLTDVICMFVTFHTRHIGFHLLTIPFITAAYFDFQNLIS